MAIAMSGNLAALNFMTVVPALACLSDQALELIVLPVMVLFGVSDDKTENDKTITSDTSGIQGRQVQGKMKENENVRTQNFLLFPLKLLKLLFNLCFLFPYRFIDILLHFFLTKLFLFPLYLIAAYQLSTAVVGNLMSSRQIMNGTFGDQPFVRGLRMLNTYGAFGSVGKQRFEPVVAINFGPEYREKEDFEALLEETSDRVTPVQKQTLKLFIDEFFPPPPRSNTTTVSKTKSTTDRSCLRSKPSPCEGQMYQENDRLWFELEFPCKPTALDRRPCLIAPYHRRADWNIWFLGFPPHTSYLQRREWWLWSFLEKVLERSEIVLKGILLTGEGESRLVDRLVGEYNNNSGESGDQSVAGEGGYDSGNSGTQGLREEGVSVMDPIPKKRKSKNKNNSKKYSCVDHRLQASSTSTSIWGSWGSSSASSMTSIKRRFANFLTPASPKGINPYVLCADEFPLSPVEAKVDMYHYEFADIDSGRWWKRRYSSSLIPSVTRESLKQMMR